MLRQKMLQDMKANKWQFLSILLMAFLGVYIFTGVGGEWAGVNHYRKGYYQETNLPTAGFGARTSLTAM